MSRPVSSVLGMDDMNNVVRVGRAPIAHKPYLELYSGGGGGAFGNTNGFCFGFVFTHLFACAWNSVR